MTSFHSRCILLHCKQKIHQSLQNLEKVTGKEAHDVLTCFSSHSLYYSSMDRPSNSNDSPEQWNGECASSNVDYPCVPHDTAMTDTISLYPWFLQEQEDHMKLLPIQQEAWKAKGLTKWTWSLSFKGPQSSMACCCCDMHTWGWQRNLGHHTLGSLILVDKKWKSRIDIKYKTCTI
jgi:hypothetical protein